MKNLLEALKITTYIFAICALVFSVSYRALLWITEQTPEVVILVFLSFAFAIVTYLVWCSLNIL